MYMGKLDVRKYLVLIVWQSNNNTGVPAIFTSGNLPVFTCNLPGILSFDVCYICTIQLPIMNKTIHHGRNVKRFREMLGIKQEGLAYQLGEDWNQKKISALEQKEFIDDPLLEEVAKLLKVPAEAIKNFDEEAAVNIISNTFTDFKDNASGINYGCNLNFNPFEKLVELFEENKGLFTALLKEKDEKISLLERALDGKK